MADSTCPSCGAPISGSVSTCPFCGGAIAHARPASTQPNNPVMSDEEVDDAQFGNHPVQNQQRPIQQPKPEPRMQQAGGYQPQPQRSRKKLWIIIAVIVIIAILMYSCSGSDDKDTKPAKPAATATQTNAAKTAGQPVVVTTGLGGNQTATGNMDVNTLYATMKQKMAQAQRRYTQAWNKVPSEYRSAAQQSINTLPKQVDAKCKSLARQYMTPGQDTERRAIYLKCNMDHLNVLNAAIERYAQDVQHGSAGDFLNYARPEGLLKANWTYRR